MRIETLHMQQESELVFEQHIPLLFDLYTPLVSISYFIPYLVIS
jgi:hypothetical protein